MYSMNGLVLTLGCEYFLLSVDQVMPSSSMDKVLGRDAALFRVMISTDEPEFFQELI